MTDYIAGLHGAYGAVMALMAREKTGRGQFIDAALYECAFNFMEAWIPAYEKLGFVPDRTGSRLIGSTPNNLYPTADGELHPHHGHGRQSVSPPGGGDGPARARRKIRASPRSVRNEHHEALDEIIGDWTAAHPLADLEAILQRSRCRRRASSRSRTSSTTRTTARATRSSRRPTSIWAASPWPVSCRDCRTTPGDSAPCRPRRRQDTREVLREVLG